MIKLKNNIPAGNFRHRFLGPWVMFFSLTAFAAFLVVNVFDTFISNPTVTSLESSTYPVNQVPFPGVSLCNINKISRRRAQKLSEYIANKTGLSEEDAMTYIRFLGYLHDSSYDRSYQRYLENFQTILDKLELKITNLMRALITPCEEFLQTCHWKGVEVNCSNIFSMRLTFEGYCCAFNYVKNTSELWREPGNPERFLVLQVGISGMKNGLSVVINNDLDDYFYTTLDSTGVNVHIFIPTDYPDKASGDLIESLATIGSENFLEVIPTTVTAVKDVMNYRVNKRNCLFEVEQQTKFGVYSQSDCFVDCRVRSLMTLCECIPFAIPLSADDTTCGLADLPCLNKNTRKWTALVPDHVEGHLLKEEEDGLLCPNTCYASCEATLYQVDASSVPLFDPHLRNYTEVHIFYGNRSHKLFLQDVVHYWFDMLSSVGGIFGLVLGYSILSVVEGLINVIKLVIAKW